VGGRVGCGTVFTPLRYIGYIIRDKFVELYLSDGWYIINPRELRSVKYYQVYLGREYSPDKIFEDLTEDEKNLLEKLLKLN
jgi:hypothetical protein